MTVTLGNVWANAQRLSHNDRVKLSQMLSRSIQETESERLERTASEIDSFFGGWTDERSTNDIMLQIQSARTKNTYENV